MTELIETSGAMKEPKVEGEKGGGLLIRGDPNKRRSTEEVTSEEFHSKKTKYNNANAARNKNRRRNKNKNRPEKNVQKPDDVSNRVVINSNTNANISKHRRGSKSKKRRHLSQKQSKGVSAHTSPKAIVSVPSNKSNANLIQMKDGVNGHVGRKSIPVDNRSFKPRKYNLTNNAPFNSTQFLMNDHESDTIQYLDSTLGVHKKEVNSAASSVRGERPVRKINRARDSSFSLDSDEDFYYSSPEDEEDFVNQEFMKAYDNARTDRLVDMSKADLIQEYLVMENRVDSLEKRLSILQNNPNLDTPPDTSPEESFPVSETTEKIKKFQRKIIRLESENESLRQMMQGPAVESSNYEMDDICHSANNDALFRVEPNDEDLTSCSTCSSNDSSSSSSSSSTSSRSSTPEIQGEITNDNLEGKEGFDTNINEKYYVNGMDNGSNDEYVDTTEDIPAISSNIQTTDAVLETSEEMEGDEDKENAEVVDGSVEVSENFVSSTGP